MVAGGNAYRTSFGHDLDSASIDRALRRSGQVRSTKETCDSNDSQTGKSEKGRRDSLSTATVKLNRPGTTRSSELEFLERACVREHLSPPASKLRNARGKTPRPHEKYLPLSH